MAQNTINILIADDDEGDRKLIKKLLDQSGLAYECTEVENVEGAIEACNQFAFDCATIDYRLPGQDGLEGVSHLHEKFPEMVIVMLTGHGSEVVAAEAMKQGASDYIVKKNLDADVLKKSILSAIDKLLFKKQLKEQGINVERSAYHDQLTDIPNRSLFEFTLSRALETAKRKKKILGVLAADLDRFEVINARLGYEIGNALLKQVVVRFQSVMQKNGMLARVSGDKFELLVEEMNKVEEAGFLAQKIIQALAKPFLIDDKKITITSSIGIATYPSSGETVSDLIRNADIALHKAKHSGKNNFQYYAIDYDQKDRIAFQIEYTLRDLIENQKFYLQYQPIYDFSTTLLFGIEPLLCWNHAELGKISFEKIIAVAEEAGLIVSLNEWTMNEACRQYHEWKLKNDTSILLTIKLSAKQLSAANWLSKMKQCMEKYQIDLRHIIFELSEISMIKEIPSAQATLLSMTKEGVQIFIDDLNINHDLLCLLKNIPISGLKIGKDCIHDIEDDSINRNFVKSLFSFADNMKLSVLVNGIETRVQMDFLKYLAEEKCKSYYLSKPLPPEEIAQLLRQA